MIELVFLGGGICQFGELCYVFVARIDRVYSKLWIFLHTFVCFFEVLSIAEKAQGGGGGVTYSTLYFNIKDRMNMRSQVDERLPYTAPSAELFTLAAASPSLLVSFSANFDEEFGDDWIAGDFIDEPPI